MKNQILAAILSLVIFSSSSCLKDNSCTTKTPQSEESDIEDYAIANGINATADPTSGLYYEILDAGDPLVKPTTSSRVYIRYTGKLLNGNIFDQVTDHGSTGWILGGLIPGWQLGLQLIGEGGHIKLIIPSALAYGCQGYGPIPGNSILYFEVQLIDVQ